MSIKGTDSTSSTATESISNTTHEYEYREEPTNFDAFATPPRRVRLLRLMRCHISDLFPHEEGIRIRCGGCKNFGFLRGRENTYSSREQSVNKPIRISLVVAFETCAAPESRQRAG